ncbi:Trk system potassium transporter TrkA [Flammeovirga pacifica]|uniref:Trk system potassium uptake protein TrkA n=1 Tax=Flammeovirga pacifica TaxID=915059 RepID=A0A1S1Z1M4_FLAPC|nr:Trk system potassium transporter TrkA [Flammeovirga pacifica]OHX67141.1 Trk system potassium transport protein TrkA [Flammeovirga pacifica]
MKIIIAGAGDVGFHLGKLLAHEDHDITLIDTNVDSLNHAANHIDVATVKGSSTSFAVLEEANVDKSDMLISVTSSEETNLITAMVAKRLGAKRTIARITNSEYLHSRDILDMRRMGVDEMISPQLLATKEIKRLLKEAAITDTFEFEKGLLSLIGITIDSEKPLVGKTLEETTYLNKDFKFLTVAILRNDETIIPRGHTKFELGDHVYYIAKPDGVESVIRLTGKKLGKKIKRLIILGGSKVGFYAARSLSFKYNVVLIEKNKEKAFQLAEELPNTLVIHGDGRNVDLLEEEGIDSADAFIAVTGDSETNIITSLVAKKHGVDKTIALVENMDYIHLSQNMGVDTLINKKLIAASFIFRYIRRGEIISLTNVHGVDAEVLEFVVNENSPVTEKVLKDLGFPKSAIIGGAIRKGKAYIPKGDFQFEPYDRAVVLTRPECISKVEAFFR